MFGRQLEAMQADALKADLEKSGKRMAELETLKEAVARLNERKTQLDEAEKTLDELRAQLKSLEEVRQGLAGEVASAKSEADKMQEIYDKQEMACENWAKEARRRLSAGDVCPVCGREILSPLEPDEHFVSVLEPVKKELDKSRAKLEEVTGKLQRNEADYLSLLVSTGTHDGPTATGSNTFDPGNIAQAFIAETVFTFIFVLVVLATTDQKKGAGNFAGLIIGLTLILIHIVCIPITGTSVNPARSIGPALMEGGQAMEQLWLFIVAPFLGGAISAGVWKFLKTDD